jgi:hypothetical protein
MPNVFVIANGPKPALCQLPQTKCSVAGTLLRRGIRVMLPVLGSLVCLACGEQEVQKAEPAEAKVSVNELQSRNSTIESDTGKKSDWVELFNPGEADESLSGYFVSDDLSDLTKGVLVADAVIPAKGFLILWLDDTSDPNTPLHFPFKLSGDGDYFFLTNPSGQVVQKVSLPPDPTGTDTTAPDVSYGAYPDGSDVFNWCQTPTWNALNAADCAPPASAAH